ncbi:MAG: hypothetical protein OK454_02445, partial [Thaumarchaeota archaeon]|nr:hypothetical protein [Nitrososphaerota archaeon]
MEGQYTFSLHFLLQEVDGKPGEHLCRVRPIHEWENRSVSCEVELEPGKYEVLPKITATRDPDQKMVEDVVKESAADNPQKLRQVGMQYDLAHAKGGVADEDDIFAKKKDEKKKKEEARKAKEKSRREKKKKRQAEKEAAEQEKKAARDGKESSSTKDAAESKESGDQDKKTAAPAKETGDGESTDQETA